MNLYASTVKHWIELDHALTWTRIQLHIRGEYEVRVGRLPGHIPGHVHRVGQVEDGLVRRLHLVGHIDAVALRLRRWRPGKKNTIRPEKDLIFA